MEISSIKYSAYQWLSPDASFSRTFLQSTYSPYCCWETESTMVEKGKAGKSTITAFVADYTLEAQEYAA